MALLTCPECDGKIADSANFCPHCGDTAFALRLKKQRIAEERKRQTLLHPDKHFTTPNGEQCKSVWTPHPSGRGYYWVVYYLDCRGKTWRRGSSHYWEDIPGGYGSEGYEVKCSYCGKRDFHYR